VKFLKKLSDFIPTGIRNKIINLILNWYETRADYHLISYPKCGRTWLRMMLGYCMLEHIEASHKNYLEINFLSIFYPALPDLSITHDDDPQCKAPHEIIQDKTDYANQKVVFLVRNPHDLIVSNYFHATKRANRFSGDISEFIRTEKGGLKSYIKFLKIWFENKDVPEDFLLIRYEDIHDDTLGELSRLLEFMDLDEIPEQLRKDAVEAAAFEKMKQKEKKQEENNKRLQPGDPDDPESYKVRRGEVDSFTDYLSHEDIEYIDNLIENELPDYYGYTPFLQS